MTRRGLLALPALLAARPGRAQAQAITLLSGAAPGSAADRWVRSFAPFLERHWPNRRIAVVPMRGEGGLAAARVLAEASADAPLLAAVATPLLLARAIERGAIGLLDRVAFLGTVAEEPVLLLGHPGEAPDLAALRALAGRATIGTPPSGSAPELAARRLAGPLGLDAIAFADAAATRAALLAGNIPAALLAAPDAIAALREGRLVALAVVQPTRSALLPEVPTLAQHGLEFGKRRAGMVARRGFIAPGGMSPGLRDKAMAALAAAAADPDHVLQAEAEGYLPSVVPGPAWAAECRATLRGLAEAG